MILVAGTNGKTSTARMIDSLLRSFGLRVGRFTSPHLTSVTERIALGGTPGRGRAVRRAYDDIAPYLDLVDSRHEDPLSFFEVLTALAYAAFADAPVDVAVVEVGMGGTWDATNVVDPAVAVVSPVGLDHQAYLGLDHRGRSPARRPGSSRPTASRCSRSRRRGRGGAAPPRAEVGVPRSPGRGRSSASLPVTSPSAASC